jgi:hypothetical protein
LPGAVGHVQVRSVLDAARAVPFALDQRLLALDLALLSLQLVTGRFRRVALQLGLIAGLASGVALRIGLAFFELQLPVVIAADAERNQASRCQAADGQQCSEGRAAADPFAGALERSGRPGEDRLAAR